MSEAQMDFLDLMESDQNDPNVQYALGRCYLYGAGVEQNGQEADKWLRRAAEQGHQEAAALLAALLEQPDSAPAAAAPRALRADARMKFLREILFIVRESFLFLSSFSSKAFLPCAV